MRDLRVLVQMNESAQQSHLIALLNRATLAVTRSQFSEAKRLLKEVQTSLDDDEQAELAGYLL